MNFIELSLSPDKILNDPLLNKGTAFTQEERDSLGLHGFLPHHISSLEEQVQRRYQNFCDQTTELSKYNFLASLQNRNEILFYRLIQEHISEMLPLIYTPTVGDVSLHYSSFYKEHRGVYFSYPLKDKIAEIVDSIPQKEISIIVVTDGERILGLGDLGIGGMAIPVGKLALYTLFGGIHPAKTLPVFLDVGTNNPTLLNDPLYLGWRHERITGKEYDDFVSLFVEAIQKRYPNVLLQWEDFAKAHARPLLDRYRDKVCSFNDDIQGTASVALAAILSAIQLSEKKKLSEQKIVLFGAGSAGIGICQEIFRAIREEGVSEEEAYKCFYMIDVGGLIHTRLDAVEAAQRPFALNFEEIKGWKVANLNHITLLEVIKHVHPTILIGVSAQPKVFSEDAIVEMSKHVERPIILPLSNPTTKSEADPKDLIRWTKGKALIATGSPFPPVEYEGRSCAIAQCNNVYIFPGVGLGAIAVGASKITDKMFLQAAHTLSHYSPLLKNEKASLFPPFEDLRAVSREIGVKVAEAAGKEGLTNVYSLEELYKKVDQILWTPIYPTYRKAFSPTG